MSQFLLLSLAAFTGLTLTSILPPVQAQANAKPGAAAGSVPESPVSGAQKLLDSGRVDDALKELELLRKQQPEPAGVERMLGLVYYQKGNVQAAEEALAKAVLQDPNDLEAAQMEGVSLFREGKPAHAIPLLERAHRDVTAANVDANYVLGLCYMDTRRYEDARKAFAADYGFPANSAQAHLLAARLFLRREYLPAARESAEKAVALSPTLPLAHELLGEVALAEARVPDAIVEFNKEQAVNPLFGGLYDRLGDAYLRAGDYNKAQQALDRAVLLEPTSTGPYILLGKVLLKQHNPLLATMYLERAVHMDPSNFMSHSLLGQAYRAAGRTEEASRETQTAEQLQASTTPKLDRPH